MITKIEIVEAIDRSVTSWAAPADWAADRNVSLVELKEVSNRVTAIDQLMGGIQYPELWAMGFQVGFEMGLERAQKVEA